MCLGLLLYINYFILLNFLVSVFLDRHMVLSRLLGVGEVTLKLHSVPLVSQGEISSFGNGMRNDLIASIDTSVTVLVTEWEINME